MPVNVSLQNNFIGGLKTEYTGLNFPENACTDTENCVFSLLGTAERREGINFEENFAYTQVNNSGQAMNTYRWRNAGGDGETEVLVTQVGDVLYFYESSNATAGAPLSTQRLSSTVNLVNFKAFNNVSEIHATECQFSDGNGYLFVFHPDCDPFYCTFNAGVITANIITMQVRDFTGIPEVGIPVSLRPLTLTPEHNYNLINQGWALGNAFTTTSTTSISFFPHTQNITIGSGLTLPNGTSIQLVDPTYQSAGGVVPITLTATVNLYSGTTASITINTVSPSSYQSAGNSGNNWIITPPNSGNVSAWFNAIGVYPSNADIWWVYKNSSDVFDPANTISNVPVVSTQAPQGHVILNVFNQQRTNSTGISGLTDLITPTRPTTGCWFQGRVWYAGVNASSPASGDQPYYTWTESIYFSQIITQVNQFGMCYQNNDPTDENFNELLPTDGGVIVIQGSGAIYKLFPMSNGILAFAQNGVYFITGNTGIGFTANDYTITRLKTSVKCISGTSFVDVLGMPYFWNEEGIYRVVNNQQGLDCEPLTVGTILGFYSNIPLDSKRFARGTYDPLSYVVSWIYRSTDETGVSNRYRYDSVLNMRVLGPKGPEVAFYPYRLGDNGVCYLSGINYINYPSGSLDPSVKYLTTVGNLNLTFSEENDTTTWFDFFAYDGIGIDYGSYFVTGYMLEGKALTRWQNNYVLVYADNSLPYAYTLNGRWDYANTGNSGRWSTTQTVTNFSPNYDYSYRRHKIRGHGQALQLKIGSVSGQRFNIIGWSTFQNIGTGP